MDLKRRAFIGIPLATIICKSSIAAQSNKEAVVTKFGINCFDLFYGGLIDSKHVRKPEIRLKELADLGISFVRFSASPFWPSEWKSYYLDRKGDYLRLMDSIFESANKLKIPLIPTLFWYPLALSDSLGESFLDWTDERSRTYSFAREYVYMMTKRYGMKDAVLCWEFANEVNINLDLPVEQAWLPKLRVDMGSPVRRSSRDSLSTVQYKVLLASFKKWVSENNPIVKVSSGNGLCRENATTYAAHIVGRDNPSQLIRAIEAQNFEGGQLTSVHVYPDFLAKYTEAAGSFRGILDLSKQAANASGNKLLLGEFGLKSSKDKHADIDALNKMIADIQDAGVDYAALWVYDFDRGQPEWSVSLDNDRAWQLHALATANQAKGR